MRHETCLYCTIPGAGDPDVQMAILVSESIGGLTHHHHTVKCDACGPIAKASTTAASTPISHFVLGGKAFAALPLAGQRLLAMLTADPPVPYAEISARLGIPAGSIGPARRRYLGKLRRHPAITALIDPGSDTA